MNVIYSIKIMDVEFLDLILAAFSVVIAIIGLFIVIRIWDKWKKLSIEVIKGRVFLNKQFLERNWTYIFLTGAILSIHQFLEIARFLKLISNGGILHGLSEILEFLAMVFLVILAYEWFRVLHQKK